MRIARRAAGMATATAVALLVLALTADRRGRLRLLGQLRGRQVDRSGQPRRHRRQQTFITGVGVSAGPGDGPQAHLLGATRATNSIGRARIDGTHVRPVIHQRARKARRAWRSTQPHLLGESRDRLDRTRQPRRDRGTIHFIDGVAYPQGLAVTRNIRVLVGTRSRSDGRRWTGSNIDRDFVTGAKSPDLMDTYRGYLYWSNQRGGSIGRASLKGDARQPELHRPARRSRSVWPWAPAASTGPTTAPGRSGTRNLDGSRSSRTHHRGPGADRDRRRCRRRHDSAADADHPPSSAQGGASTMSGSGSAPRRSDRRSGASSTRRSGAAARRRRSTSTSTRASTCSRSAPPMWPATWIPPRPGRNSR